MKDSNILIIDDFFSIRKKLKKDLRKLGFTGEIVEASNGEKALEAISSRKDGFFKLIITDIEMPEMDGIELIKTVKNNHKLTKLPILVVSVINTKDKVLEAMASGAKNYLLKPWDYNELMYRISKVMIGK
jgi:two-component system chemotaxis response regulator CheY